jgi:hypothetical protein
MPEPDEAEGGQQEDGVGHLEGGEHHDGADGVGDDVASHDARARATHDPHRLHVLADAQGQRLPADEPAGTSQLTKAMTKMMRSRTGVEDGHQAMRRKSTGMESSMSTIRIMTASTQPPMKPDRAP